MASKKENLERQRKGVQARRDAVATLIKTHQDEFDELVAKNRVALGLPPRANGPTKDELEERIRKQEERLEKLKRELRLAS